MKNAIDFTIAAVTVAFVLATSPIWERFPRINEALNPVIDHIETRHDFGGFWRFLESTSAIFN